MHCVQHGVHCMQHTGAFTLKVARAIAEAVPTPKNLAEAVPEQYDCRGSCRSMPCCAVPCRAIPCRAYCACVRVCLIVCTHAYCAYAPTVRARCTVCPVTRCHSCTVCMCRPSTAVSRPVSTAAYVYGPIAYSYGLWRMAYVVCGVWPTAYSHMWLVA